MSSLLMSRLPDPIAEESVLERISVEKTFYYYFSDITTLEKASRTILFCGILLVPIHPCIPKNIDCAKQCT